MKSNQFKIPMRSIVYIFSLFVAILVTLNNSYAQESPKEEDFFKINKLRSPEGTLLEVGVS